MKIVHIYRDCLVEGGVPHQTRQLIAAEAALGHEVFTISNQGPESCVRTSPRPLKHLRVRNNLSGLRKVQDFLADNRPDIAHVTALSIPAHELWIRELERLDLPYVVSPHGLLEPLGLGVQFGAKPNSRAKICLKRAYRLFLDRRLLQRAAAVHAQSSREAELSLRESARDVRVIPMGVDSEWVEENRDKTVRCHAAPTFLYLGRLDLYHKGLDLVLDALDDPNLKKNIKVILAGTDVRNSTAIIRDRIKRRNLRTVELRGGTWGSQKKLLWEEVDFFLNIFRYAGMSRACGEAVGRGIPVIASRESNWGDWADVHSFGVVTKLTREAVLRAFQTCVSIKKARYRELSANAREFACSNSWASVGRQMIDLYSDVIES
jgi:glycosyltransferase involved in cell wall biosynthesis